MQYDKILLMFLKKLKLTNYRNYSDFEQTFNHLKTIIIGQNAQGKSNILEAINLLATSQSERADKDNELVLWNKEYALLFAEIEKKDSFLEIALQINPSGRRKLKINGVPKKAVQADLLGNFFAVLFSCNDIFLIKGGPSLRRKWLDSILFQLNNKYHKLLLDYQKSTSQKNALLKKAHETGMSTQILKKELEIWNEQIINLGSDIISIRLVFIKEIQPLAERFLHEISKETEILELNYQGTISKENNIKEMSINSLKEAFTSSISQCFDEEFIRCQSLIGPHRDDLKFVINKKEAKSFASQGQQRSIILALKLAEVKIIEKRKEEIPVLLLDDVFAELDESRQNYLLHNLPTNIQTFLTTTHISDLQKEFLEDAQILNIQNGRILEMSHGK